MEIGFSDWIYPGTDTPMIKMQHPDYELFSADSTHYKAGVACADCHMPYTRDGAVKYSTHNVRSPLLNLDTACGACHTDVTYVAERVAIIQDQVRERMEAAEEALVDAIAALIEANANPAADQACWKKPACCTVKRSCAGISSQPKTAWVSTTPARRCASWLPQPTWPARPSSRPSWPAV
jgi:formate-dependent nitrite reductase cytochrome c552 subunit